MLSAGGVRGVAFAGAVHELTRLGILDLRRVTLFAGTSVGALVAALLAVGCTPEELLHVAHHLDLSQFVQVNLATLVYSWGLDDQSRLRAFLGQHVARKLGRASVTLGELQTTTGREVCFCVTNVTLNRPEYFTTATHPSMALVDAVLLSLALPPVFAPVKHHGALYIDGAFLDSFPIRDLDPATTLGLRLRWAVACNLNSIEQFYSRLAFCALHYAERTPPAGGPPIVDIDVGDVSTVNFALPRWNVDKLIDDWRTAVARFVLRKVLDPDKRRMDLPQADTQVHEDQDEHDGQDDAPERGLPAR